MLVIADEPIQEVQEAVESRGGKFWIGWDPEQQSMKRYAEEGSLPIPQYYLVDVDGVVIGSDLPDGTAVEKQLERAFMPALGRDLHEKLADAVAAYARDAAGAAWTGVQAFLEDEDETLAEDATFLCEKVERYVAWQRERIERALSSGKRSEAMGDLLVFEVRFAGMDASEWAVEQVKALKAEKEIHADRFAWDKLQKALAKEAKGVESKGARKSVLSAYGEVVKRHPDTVAARIAAERMAALEHR